MRFFSRHLILSNSTSHYHVCDRLISRAGVYTTVTIGPRRVASFLCWICCREAIAQSSDKLMLLIVSRADKERKMHYASTNSSVSGICPFSLSVSYLAVHAPTTSSHSVNSPLSPSITPSLFHFRLKTYLVHKKETRKPSLEVTTNSLQATARHLGRIQLASD